MSVSNAIALTDKFYLDVSLGVENWRSNKAWMNMAVYTNDDALILPLSARKILTLLLSSECRSITRMSHTALVSIGHDDPDLLHYRLKYMTHTTRAVHLIIMRNIVIT